MSLKQIANNPFVLFLIMLVFIAIGSVGISSQLNRHKWNKELIKSMNILVNDKSLDHEKRAQLNEKTKILQDVIRDMMPFQLSLLFIAFGYGFAGALISSFNFGKFINTQTDSEEKEKKIAQ